ncbi:MAG: helix-turn-helix domain-containing protein [Holosporaceae bacterium]|nr:helix-turn-helix domain-containing protein [Holosporaceae bacterium]
MINSLKKAREEKKLSLSDVSDILKIRECYLDAIEQGDYASLPELVYVVGFVKSYAKFLGVNDNCIVQEIKDYVTSLQEFSENNHLTGIDAKFWSDFLVDQKIPYRQKNEARLFHICKKKCPKTQDADENDDKSGFHSVSVFFRDFSCTQIIYTLVIIAVLISIISLL